MRTIAILLSTLLFSSVALAKGPDANPTTTKHAAHAKPAAHASSAKPKAKKTAAAHPAKKQKKTAQTKGAAQVKKRSAMKAKKAPAHGGKGAESGAVTRRLRVAASGLPRL